MTRTNPFASDHLRLTQSGSDVLLKIDHDGKGHDRTWQALVTFENADAAAFTVENFSGFGPDGAATAASHTRAGFAGTLIYGLEMMHLA